MFGLLLTTLKVNDIFRGYLGSSQIQVNLVFRGRYVLLFKKKIIHLFINRRVIEVQFTNNE